MAKLRDGLIDPKEIPEQDLPDYVATTYGGYYEEIQNRLWELERFLAGHALTARAHFGAETIALQLRICCELIAYAVGDFDQISHGIVSKSKRTENDVEKVLGARASRDVWPHPVHPSWSCSVPLGVKSSLPSIKIESLENAKQLNKLEGRLSDIIHAKRRPRPNDHGRMTTEDLLNTIRQIKIFSDRHFIFDQTGDGWLVDSRMAYRQSTNAAPATTVVRCSFTKHVQ